MLPKEEWQIACELFAPYGPLCQETQEENPVEGIWLQVPNLIRRFYYLCKKK